MKTLDTLRTLNEGDLSMRQILILDQLSQKPQPNLLRIGNEVRISTAAMTGQIDRLEQMGYVTRTKPLIQEDRRRNMILLTEKGRLALDAALVS